MSLDALSPCKKALFISIEFRVQLCDAAIVKRIRYASFEQVGDCLSTVSISSSSKPRATSLAFFRPSFSIKTQRREMVDWPSSSTSVNTSRSLHVFSSCFLASPKSTCVSKTFSSLCGSITRKLSTFSKSNALIVVSGVFGISNLLIC